MSDNPTRAEVRAHLEFMEVAMADVERWTEEDQMALVVLATSMLGDVIPFEQQDIQACSRAARILAHMIGAEVPGEDDGR